MKINEVKATPGARKKAVRKGRGYGSGLGKTSGRGHKGQGARSGGGKGPMFEGGQMPLFRRLPKRGFNSRNKKHYIVVNVGDLEVFADDAVIDAQVLDAAGIITLPKVNDGLKILGNGDLSKRLHVKAAAFTVNAKEKILKAGGQVEVI
ncbi:MAG: 50S ribosomal protein L15 [Saccharofermentanales bacterium]|jgi:large subunit ribosomal protein L15|nr:50S ribosomal protein L15 [Bacillota bacterium]